MLGCEGKDRALVGGLLVLVGGPKAHCGLPGGAVRGRGCAHRGVGYPAEIVTELFSWRDREDGSG